MLDRTQALLNCIHDAGAPTIQDELTRYDELGLPVDQKLFALHKVVLAGFSVAEIKAVLSSRGVIDPNARLFLVDSSRGHDHPCQGSNSKWVHRARMGYFQMARRIGVERMREMIAEARAKGLTTIRCRPLSALSHATERLARWQAELNVARAGEAQQAA